MSAVINVNLLPSISLTIESNRWSKQIQPRSVMAKKRLAAYRLTIAA